MKNTRCPYLDGCFVAAALKPQHIEGCAILPPDAAIAHVKERVPTVALSLWLCPTHPLPPNTTPPPPPSSSLRLCLIHTLLPNTTSPPRRLTLSMALSYTSPSPQDYCAPPPSRLSTTLCYTPLPYTLLRTPAVSLSLRLCPIHLLSPNITDTPAPLPSCSLCGSALIHPFPRKHYSPPPR